MKLAARSVPNVVGSHCTWRITTPLPALLQDSHRNVRFLVFALDTTIPDDVRTSKALLTAMAGHVLARGVLTGTYERG